jgi:hypothetical protein
MEFDLFKSDWAAYEEDGEWHVDIPAERAGDAEHPWSRIVIAENCQNREVAEAIASLPRLLKYQRPEAVPNER